MPAFYKIDKERRLVISTGAGVTTLADIQAHQQRLLSDPDFDPSFSQLMDMTQVTRLELSADDIQLLAQTKLFSPNSRRSILVKSDMVYGLGRMFGTLRDLMGEDGIRVFRNLDEALDWVLTKQRD